jgi:hypothetical protein
MLTSVASRASRAIDDLVADKMCVFVAMHIRSSSHARVALAIRHARLRIAAYCGWNAAFSAQRWRAPKSRVNRILSEFDDLLVMLGDKCGAHRSSRLGV